MTVLDRIKGTSAGIEWIREHLDFPHKDWCLIWPFSRSQNGYVYCTGDKIPVHRLMCEHRNGPPPTSEHHAAHSCGRGADGCVNPWHVSWKTIGENQVERYQHSGPSKRAKLTPEQVDEIKALKGRMRINDIASMYGVSDTNIRLILAGKLWHQTSSLTRRVFSEEEVLLIRSTPKQIKTTKQFADEFGVPWNTIDRIKTRRTYKWVCDETSSQHTSPELS